MGIVPSARPTTMPPSRHPLGRSSLRVVARVGCSSPGAPISHSVRSPTATGLATPRRPSLGTACRAAAKRVAADRPSPESPGRLAGLRRKVGLFKLTSRCETGGGRVQRPRCPGVSLPLCGARGLRVVKGNCSSFPGRAPRTTRRPTRSAVATASRADDAYSRPRGWAFPEVAPPADWTADAGGATGTRRALIQPPSAAPGHSDGRSPDPRRRI